jgi:hypothetical protein
VKNFTLKIPRNDLTVKAAFYAGGSFRLPLRHIEVYSGHKTEIAKAFKTLICKIPYRIKTDWLKTFDTDSIGLQIRVLKSEVDRLYHRKDGVIRNQGHPISFQPCKFSIHRLSATFGLPEYQLSVMEIIGCELQHLTNSHAASGHQFQNQSIRDLGKAEDDLVYGVFFDFEWDR